MTLMLAGGQLVHLGGTLRSLSGPLGRSTGAAARRAQTSCLPIHAVNAGLEHRASLRPGSGAHIRADPYTWLRTSRTSPPLSRSLRIAPLSCLRLLR